MLLLSAVACTSAAPERVVEQREQLDAVVGQRITLIGVQSRTKQPMVLGVDVDGDYALSDRRVRATGVLERRTVAPEPFDPDAPARTSRGPGTFYSLVDPQSGDLARTELARP
jgi:hypothetical protein